MNIKTRLAVRFTGIVAVILTVFSFSLFYFSANYRQDQFYSRLEDRAHSTARLLFALKKENIDLFKIGKSSDIYPDRDIFVYDESGRIISTNDKSSPVEQYVFEKLKKEGEIRFKNGDKEGVGFRFKSDDKNYYYIVSAYDTYGLKKLYFLKFSLIVGWLFSIIITAIASWFYADNSLKPISKVIEQVKNISAKNLGMRVDTGNGTDEIARLSIKFNMMLDRLESAFKMQQSFVSNASHELRTPLTAITGQIDVALMHDRNSDEYREILSSVLEDIKNLNQLTHGLLDLAQVSVDESVIRMDSLLRIDDLIMQIREDMIAVKKDFYISLFFEDSPEDENILSVKGNENLLRIAISNLMSNAYNFSKEGHKELMISFRFKRDQIIVVFKDKGIGISQDDLNRITEPFYRASNAINIKGHGIGLSLSDRIMRLHQGEMLIASKLNYGTSVTLKFPINKF
jgi:signal transduction histidine kinase